MTVKINGDVGAVKTSVNAVKLNAVVLNISYSKTKWSHRINNWLEKIGNLTRIIKLNRKRQLQLIHS
ncbi:hypothetical protein ACJDU8_14645 [Clostridium sp. WILCCON 0269]|uniref:Uncharacterized protein n=1 Tax=Candidatus Clostridium eludens TaxID=3381663 RepID=A0ABW8SPY9_9CLOT